MAPCGLALCNPQEGATALHLACMEGSDEAAEVLVARGANAALLTEVCRSPHGCCHRAGGRAAPVRTSRPRSYLLAWTAKEGSRVPQSGYSCLHVAAMFCKATTAEVLLKAGANKEALAARDAVRGAVQLRRGTVV